MLDVKHVVHVDVILLCTICKRSCCFPVNTFARNEGGPHICVSKVFVLCWYWHTSSCGFDYVEESDTELGKV
jgi:hypothetical protein